MTGTAAVIGGSVAGLLAARALSQRFERVLVYERDELSSEPRPRKGVPQARHAHVLLAAGAKALRGLLPGLFDDVAAHGGFSFDMGQDNNWFHFGSWKRRFACGVEVNVQSRDLLECVVRRQVLRAANVELCRASVVGVDWESGKPCVEADGRRDEFEFLVDASGRASRLPDWLEKAGFQRPREDSVRVDVTYTTACFRPTRERDFRALLIYPNPPGERRAGAILPIEGGSVLAGVFGWCGERAEPNDASVMAYARSLPQPEVSEFLEHAERISDFSSYHFREARLRHYEELAQFPACTVVLGDALCSVDPVFGQGMTVAALSAQILEACANDASLDCAALADAFRGRVSDAWKTAWLLSTGEDFRYAEVTGTRPLGTALSHWYTRHVQKLTAFDDDVYRRFARVMHLLDSPAALFHPSVLGKVMLAAAMPERSVLRRPRDGAR